MKRTRAMPLIVSLVVGALVAVGLGLALLQPAPGAAQRQGDLLEYPDYPPTPTVGPNPTAAPGLASGPVLAQADFATPDALGAWTVVDLTSGPAAVLAESSSNWRVAEGRLVQDYAGRARNPSIQETLALTSVGGAADVALQVSFYDEYNGTAGVVARYSGASGAQASYYRFRALKASYPATPKLVLEKVVGGVATALVEIKGPGFAERAWHTLGLTVVGGQLTATLDGVVVAEAQDPSPLGAGQAGLYTRAIGGIFFDDVLVSAP